MAPLLKAAFFFLAIFGGGFVRAEVVSYPSGLMRDYTDNQGAGRGRNLTERQAIDAFIDEHFKDLGPSFQWKEKGVLEDARMKHHRFELYYKGRRVVDRHLKVHYRKDGWVQYGSSGLYRGFEVALPAATTTTPLEQKLRSEFKAKHAVDFKGYLSITPVIWVAAQGAGVAALEVVMNSMVPFSFRRFYVAEGSLELLEEKRSIRNVSTTNNVYPINPTDTALSSQTIPDLDALTALSNSYIHVRRQENISNPTLRDVRADTDFSAEAGFSTDPNSYAFTCTGAGATSCPNQGFDSVNVYYHVNGWRQQVATYLTGLGATTTFSDDPLNVIVNLLISVSNNAAYLDSPCTEDGSVPKCLLFLRPEPLDDDRCGASTVDFYDLAREANVAVHEYQHYITDTIAGLVAGSSTQSNVGDVIHEGYSDYFGASFVSTASGGNASEIGSYSFQECTYFARDIATLRPIELSDDELSDPHLGGHSFASGLWALRNDYGASVVDRIALQSLFLLPTLPGSYDAVEALVRADELLYGGAHTDRIRSVFYTSLNFIGGPASSFRDASYRVREVGFNSCTSTPFRAGSATGNLAAMLFWGLLTLGAGRWFRRGSR